MHVGSKAFVGWIIFLDFLITFIEFFMYVFAILVLKSWYWFFCALAFTIVTGIEIGLNAEWYRSVKNKIKKKLTRK